MRISFEPQRSEWTELIERPKLKKAQLSETVKSVFDDVKRNSDVALAKYARMFDGFEQETFKVSQEQIDASSDLIENDLKLAIKQAAQNIEKFHLAQKRAVKKVNISQGIECWQEQRPIDRVGLYIPGGSAPLFSTVLMLGIPAKIAGCNQIVLCSPGPIHPTILYCAKILGLDQVFQIGGMQAIAAMTYGSVEIPKVDKIFGPGNQYVTAAKQFALQEGVAIDMPAGPSEVLVMADQYAQADFIASDLLSQAEHGGDSQVIMLTNSKSLIKEVELELRVQQKSLSRSNITERALENARLIYFDKLDDLIDFSNQYGPEHLIVNFKDYQPIISRITCAGSVFLGPYSPESAGDYASGTNHTLPTNGFAKAYSGVELSSFQTSISFQALTREGLENIAKTVELMATAEGLDAHANAVSIRLKKVEL
ncbi:histidinol dehydrogenase [Flavobacteriaceae bacterium]|nr:histidinol dehydrogenase [Flavobacteriaceae bacterium]